MELKDGKLILKPGETVTVVAEAQATTPIPTTPQPPITSEQPSGGEFIQVGPSFRIKSLDDVSLAQPGLTVLLERGKVIAMTKAQKIAVAGVTIRSVVGTGEPATIHYAGGAHSRAIQVVGPDFTLADVKVMGKNKAAIVRVEKAQRTTLKNVHQVIAPDGGMVSLAEIDGSEDATIEHCSTEKTDWNGLYFGGPHPNRNAKVTNCHFGPSVNEHSLRAYALFNAKIHGNTFDNRDHSLKQAYKLMSGDGIDFKANIVYGSARHGRDANDPPDQTLNGLVIYGCEYHKCTWLRFDPGCKAAIFQSKINMERDTALSVAGDARVYIEQTKITGATKLADNPGKVTQGSGVQMTR